MAIVDQSRDSFDVRYSEPIGMSAEELRLAREAGMRPEVEEAARVIAALPVTTGERATR